MISGEVTTPPKGDAAFRAWVERNLRDHYADLLIRKKEFDTETMTIKAGEKLYLDGRG